MRRFAGGFQPKNKKPKDAKQRIRNDEDAVVRRTVLEKLVDNVNDLIERVKRLEHPTRPVPKVKKLMPKAMLPTRGTSGSAGLDLYSIEHVTLWPGDVKEIHTGIAMQIPKGHCGIVMTRSSYAKKAVRNAGGATLVDEDYRGEIKVYLRNDGEYAFSIDKGDRVAQMVIIPYSACDVIEVEELNETQRGSGGFGSTGR